MKPKTLIGIVQRNEHDTIIIKEKNMNMDLLMILVFAMVMVIYLTMIPRQRLNDFGDFLKKVLGVLPITKIAEAFTKGRTRKPEKEEET